MRSRKPQLPAAGFSLVEIIFAIAIAAIFALVSASLSSDIHSMLSEAQVAWLNEVPNSVMVEARNDLAWSRTINDPKNIGNFNCVLNPQIDCTTTAARGLIPLFLLDSSGNPAWGAADPTTPTDGLTFQGERCNSFSAGGNDNCPFRYDVYWRVQCLTSPCFKPQIEVVGKLTYSPSGNLKRRAINTDRFAFTAFRQNGSDLVAACNALGGLFDGVNCVPPPTPPLNAICPPNRPFVGGFDNNGQPICREIAAPTCPADQYIGHVDFNPNTGIYSYSCYTACGVAGPVITVTTR